ncbi:MAG: flagellar hook-basal body complex protein [Phycisphaerales bacterium]
MASTTALFSALSGLNANARNLDVIGNNIANVNTTAYKSSRMVFSNMFSRTISEGTPPGEVTGGTNPFQIGLGVKLAGTQRNMTNGTISATGDNRDLAIDGNGYFLVQRGDQQFYTRAGNFRPNELNELTTINGERVMGYGVDEQFNLIPGVLAPVSLPLGALTIVEPTTNVKFAGNLNANGTLPTGGSIYSLGGTSTDGFRAIASAAPAPAAPNLLESTTRLVDIEDPLLPGSNTLSFVSGQTLRITGATKGTRLLPDADLKITDATTVQDLMNFMTQALGISNAGGANPDGNTPGLTLDPVTGKINLVGNTGTVNDIALESADLRLLDASGATVRFPFVSNKAATADGEAVRTAFVAYDSLGTPVTVDVSMSIVSRTSAGTTWRYYVESADNAGVDLQSATGILTFDNEGRMVNPAPVTVTINRDNQGSITPLTFTIDFADATNEVTALTDVNSEVAAIYRDGAPIGTLTSYGIGTDGTIVGVFSNGVTRTMGQIALATFTNDEGLVEVGNNLYTVGANSGAPVVSSPGTFGAGQLVQGSLELSNVDIGDEFIKLILTSTGYSANARVIRTTDELMQSLLVLGR